METSEALLAEYSFLTQAILDSITHRTQIVSFGLGTIGVLAAGVVSWDGKPTTGIVDLVTFCLVIPFLSMTIFLVWLGEVERMFTIGNHLRGLERRINTEDKGHSDPMRWSQMTQNQRVYPYIVVGILFGFTATASLCFGCWLSKTSPLDVWASHPGLFGLMAALMAALGLFAIYQGVALLLEYKEYKKRAD